MRALGTVLGFVILSLAGCATTPSRDGGGLDQFHLFDGSGRARFAFYYSCAGLISVEQDLCWVPEKYFSQWAHDRHVSIAELQNDQMFNPKSGALSPDLVKSDPDINYRIVVRFLPLVVPGYKERTSGVGQAYIIPSKPPKVGYQADLQVFASNDGALVAETSYHSKTDAPFDSDAVPYIKAGVQMVLGAIDGRSD